MVSRADGGVMFKAIKFFGIAAGVAVAAASLATPAFAYEQIRPIKPSYEQIRPIGPGYEQIRPIKPGYEQIRPIKPA